jgi:Pentapeptide repeats (8 copies)
MRPMPELSSATPLGCCPVMAVILTEKFAAGSQPTVAHLPPKPPSAPMDFRVLCIKVGTNHTLTADEPSVIQSNHLVWLTSDNRKLDDQRRANLCRAKIQGSALSDFNLQEANLFGIDLRNAILSNTILEGANLIMAELQGARLIETNLQRLV